jgi:hypothetical protein
LYLNIYYLPGGHVDDLRDPDTAFNLKLVREELLKWILDPLAFKIYLEYFVLGCGLLTILAGFAAFGNNTRLAFQEACMEGPSFSVLSRWACRQFHLVKAPFAETEIILERSRERADQQHGKLFNEPEKKPSTNDYEALNEDGPATCDTPLPTFSEAEANIRRQIDERVKERISLMKYPSLRSLRCKSMDSLTTIKHFNPSAPTRQLPPIDEEDLEILVEEKVADAMEPVLKDMEEGLLAMEGTIQKSMMERIPQLLVEETTKIKDKVFKMVMGVLDGDIVSDNEEDTKDD